MIVLIVLDQLRADALGCAGNPYVRTPSLDALASRSIRFETCLTNGPLCRPARMTLMTGLPVHEHGQISNQGVRPPAALPSHVRQMREAGWHTAVVGKTHLHDGTGHLDEHRGVLDAWGFADALELPDPRAHWLRSAHSDWLGPRKHERWRSFVIQEQESHELASPDDAPWCLAPEDHLDRFCARAAIERIRTLPRRSYLQVSFPGPHPPFDPPRAWLDSLALDEAPPPILERTGPLSPVAASYRSQRRRTWSEAEWRRVRRAYFAKVSFLDACVGEVLDAIPDDAWIILTSDHGELLVDHGVTGKVLPYEQATRVPLMIRPPGGCDGRVVREVVDHLDVVATLRSLGGIESPHGRTLLNDVSSKEVVFECMGYVALRTERATLAWDRRLDEPVELYDRSVDPQETHNAVRDSPQLLEEMAQRLRSRLVG